MSMLKDFSYHAPVSLKEALRLLQKSRAGLLLAGGTFVLNHLKKSVKYPTDVIGLKRIVALRGIRRSRDEVAVGAMTTIAELMESPLIFEDFPSLGDACRRLGTTPVRHMATIGGNIASRFFWVDLPAVLLSLDARLIALTTKGSRTISLKDFLKKKPLEKFILTTILLPRTEAATYYFRHTRTMEVDVPALALASSIQVKNSRFQGARLFVNTAISAPLELERTEAAFEGKDRTTLEFKGVSAALQKDLDESGLDAGRCLSLENDVEKLIGILKDQKR